MQSKLNEADYTMTKESLVRWLIANPGNQRRIEQKAGLSSGYLYKIKSTSVQPFKSTLLRIENAVKEIISARNINI